MKDIKKIPHGTIKAIAEKTGISKSTICQILKGNESPKKAIVLNVAAEYLAEYKAKELEAEQSFKEVMKAETAGQLTARLKRQKEKYGENASPLL